jgi:hypothetical protein
MFAAGVAVGGVALLQRAVLANEDFVVRDVQCRTDGALTRAEILHAAGPLEGRHILQVNIDAVGKALRQQPLVHEATVERRFPASVSIAVRERTPIVWFFDRARGAESRDVGGVLLDRTGVAIRCDVLRAEYVSTEQKKEDPVACGEQIRDAAVLAAIELHGILTPVCEEHSLQVERYLVHRHYVCDAVLAGGLTVRFAVEYDKEKRSERFAEQVDLFKRTLWHCSSAGRIPAAIDLTLADAVAVRHVVPRAQVVQEELLPAASLEDVPDEEISEFIPEIPSEFPEEVLSPH